MEAIAYIIPPRKIAMGVCIGEFNEILHSFEKQGGVPKPQIQMGHFRNVLTSCNLKDHGFEGDIFYMAQ